MPHSNSGSDARTESPAASEFAASEPAASGPAASGPAEPSEPAADATAAGDRATPAGDRTTPAGDRSTPAGDRSTPAGDRSGPVFGVKAARGQAPYAILGRTSGSPLPAPTPARSPAPGEAPRGAPAAEGEPEAASPSTHALRVAGGQVLPAEAAGDEAREGDRGKGVHEVQLPPIDPSLPLVEKPAEAMRLAQEAFSQTGYWVSFYRAILGAEGAVSQLFPDPEEKAAFEETAEFAEIHTMLTALRASDVEKIDAVEPQTMITIRMPRSLRAVLVEEAKALGVSINKLCISKLLLPINPRFVPPERGRVRGRKPGEQKRSNRAKKPQEVKKGEG